MTGDAAEPRDADSAPAEPNSAPPGRDRTAASSTAPFRIVVPPEKGPVLETYYRGRRWFGAAFMFVLAVVVYTVATAGFAWMTTWGPWIPVALASVLPLLLGGTEIAVGAGWLQCGKAWVDLHDLQTIGFSRTAYDGRSLELRDRSDRWVMVNMDRLSANDRLWELVHPALRVSMNKGAQFNSLARKELIPVLTALE